MKIIKKLKKQARLRAIANGTSHQSELNAIAREMGHAAWGALQRFLSGHSTTLETSSIQLKPLIDDDQELSDLIDAYQAARKARGHLVVVRSTHEEEDHSIGLLWQHLDDGLCDSRLEGIAFTPFLDQGGVAMQEAESHEQTLVAGSGVMKRTINHGNFVVHDPQQTLHQMNTLYSKRDQSIIYATTAVKYLPPQNDGPTVQLDRNAVGFTTIRRSSHRRAV